MLDHSSRLPTDGGMLDDLGLHVEKENRAVRSDGRRLRHVWCSSCSQIMTSSRRPFCPVHVASYSVRLRQPVQIYRRPDRSSISRSRSRRDRRTVRADQRRCSFAARPHAARLTSESKATDRRCSRSFRPHGAPTTNARRCRRRRDRGPRPRPRIGLRSAAFRS